MNAGTSIVLTEDGSPTLLDAATGAHYHSMAGALGESRHVFLEGSALAQRLAQGQRVRLLEVGTGTGLNFLLSVQAAVENSQGELAYTGFEPALPSPETLKAYYAHLPDFAPLAAATGLTAGRVQGQLGNCTFQVLPVVFPPVEFPLEKYDIVYFDAFGPGVVPDQWQPAGFGSAANALAPGGVLVTYSVTGDVKRWLRANGFLYERPPGFGPKRQMLRVFGP